MKKIAILISLIFALSSFAKHKVSILIGESQENLFFIANQSNDIFSPELIDFKNKILNYIGKFEDIELEIINVKAFLYYQSNYGYLQSIISSLEQSDMVFSIIDANYVELCFIQLNSLQNLKNIKVIYNIENSYVDSVMDKLCSGLKKSLGQRKLIYCKWKEKISPTEKSEEEIGEEDIEKMSIYLIKSVNYSEITWTWFRPYRTH